MITSTVTFPAPCYRLQQGVSGSIHGSKLASTVRYLVPWLGIRANETSRIVSLLLKILQNWLLKQQPPHKNPRIVWLNFFLIMEQLLIIFYMSKEVFVISTTCCTEINIAGEVETLCVCVCVCIYIYIYIYIKSLNNHFALREVFV